MQPSLPCVAEAPRVARCAAPGCGHLRPVWRTVRAFDHARDRDRCYDLCSAACFLVLERRITR